MDSEFTILPGHLPMLKWLECTFYDSAAINDRGNVVLHGETMGVEVKYLASKGIVGLHIGKKSAYITLSSKVNMADESEVRGLIRQAMEDGEFD